MKSRKLDLFVCISCGVVIAGFVFFSSDRATLVSSFRDLKLWWILAACGCMVIYWLMESIALHLLLKKSDPGRSFKDSFKVAMGGQYFNAITPFSSGGQPFQAYYLTRQGMDVGDAAVGLLGRFLVYQTALVAVSTVLLILRMGYFREKVQNFALVVLIGYLINFIVLALLVAVGVFRGAAEKGCRWVIRAGGKLRLLKDPQKASEHAEKSLLRFHANFRALLRHGGRLWVGFFLSVIQLLAYLAVPWFIYLAFGLSGADPLTMLGAQGFVMMIASFVPIPGAGVGSEGAFYFFFRHLFPGDGQVAVAMILWRLITFYLTVVVGAGFAIRANKNNKPKEEDETRHEDRTVQ
ncbi:MAG: flippase-like domain-containing protein [Clostridia bacterium]|nr:flippase-like domain-containing protein [Clostridia bacterium]